MKDEEPVMMSGSSIGMLVGVGGLGFAPHMRPIPGTDMFKLHVSPGDIGVVPIPRSGIFASLPPLEQFDCILNTLTVPDLGAAGLRALAPLATAYPGRFLNAPAAVLRSKRDEVSRSLREIPGLIAPPAAFFRGESSEMWRAIRNADVTFPAILRKAGTHLGHSMVLIEKPEDVGALIEPAYFYYLTTYVEYCGGDGLYRKYRIFFIGDAVITRHVLISDSWNVHAEARSRFMQLHLDLVAEEQAIMSARDGIENRFAGTLDAVRKAIGLDFFGMDCTVLDTGELLLFEANSSMNFFDSSLDNPANWHLRERVGLARSAFRHMVYGNYVPAEQRLDP